MLSKRHQVFLLPVQISEYVLDHDLVRPFQIFLYLKMFAGDKIADTDPVFEKLRNDLRMTDPKNRTFKNHFKKLLELNWIGFNKKSGIYHMRSFDYIRAINGFKGRRATKLFYKDISQLQVYISAIMICKEIYAQKFYWERVKRRARTATIKRDVAMQAASSFLPSQPPYYGICNKTIARLLGCKYTNACNLKQAAANARYITTRHRYKDVAELLKLDYSLRANYALSKPLQAKKLRFWRQLKNGQKIVKVVLQLHDEIIPNMEFKRVSSFSALNVPFAVVKKFLPQNSSANAA
jgi:hypothetical protein